MVMGRKSRGCVWLYNDKVVCVRRQWNTTAPMFTRSVHSMQISTQQC